MANDNVSAVLDLKGGGSGGSVTPASIVTATGQMTEQQQADTRDNLDAPSKANLSAVVQALSSCVQQTVSITHSQLKLLRDNGNLIPGQQYRITDYVCTVANDSEARAVSHPYDIIVTADDASTLNENARACLHSGDAYYSANDCKADLSAWELKYCLDNDTDRFAWADATNGKGVVFWLKDDWGNECPYDFKQIQFKRYKITACDKSPDLVDFYIASKHSDDITIDSDDFIWCYTFSIETDDEGGVGDTSVLQNSLTNDEGIIQWTYGNKMLSRISEDEDYTKQICYLPNNVFLTSLELYNEFLAPYSNTFGHDCGYNTFGNGCSSNTFGDDCISNTFGNDCGSNTFGDSCWSNTFGDSCGSNTFGNDCRSNTFGNNCGYNTFGNDCRSNTFGNNCGYNTFGDSCWSNTFGNDCWSNTFGNNCGYNTFATASGGSTAQSNFRNITFEDGVNYVVLYQSTTSSSAYVQNYHVLNGLQGTNNSKINVEVSTNLEYCTFVGKNTSGTVKTYNIMDGAR